METRQGSTSRSHQGQRAKDIAKAIVSELIGDQSSDIFKASDKGFPFEVDFRSCGPKDIAQGIVSAVGDFAASFIADVDGVDNNFPPSALEKLHFLNGVLYS